VAREWRDLFIIDGAGAPGAGAEPEGDENRGGRFRRLRESLRKTRQALQSEIQATLFEELNDETWERLEEALIYADVGAQTTAKVVSQLELEASENKLSGGQALSDRLVELLTQIAQTGDDTIDLRANPTVILVAGVNGTGKTTTVGKARLASQPRARPQGVPGRRRHLPRRGRGAARAVGPARRGGIRQGIPGRRPRSVAYDGVSTAIREGADVLIVDTAGRLSHPGTI